MGNENNAVAKLFSDQELDNIQASGSPWIISNDDPATVPVPFQTSIVNVQGSYTERDRKLWVFLLHAVFDQLDDKPMHEISVKDINAVFREVGSDHGTKWMWDSIKRLANTTVEWETLDDERMEVEEWGVATMLFATITKPHRQSGRLNFGFPPNLIPIIQQPRRFARLRLHFLMSLSGKYAVTLYEILEGFANRRDNPRVTIEELRRWLKVPEGTYPDWKNFRHRVLRPAVEQINADPVASGFTVEYEPIRKGKFYHEIAFKLTKSGQRIGQEKQIKQAKSSAQRMAQLKAKGRPMLTENAIAMAARETRNYLDMAQVEREFWAHWEATGKPEFQSVSGAFKNFTKKKYGQAKYGKA